MKDEDRKLWEDRIADYRSSGLTAFKWAEDRGIAVHSLRYYIHKFNKEKKLESDLAHLVKRRIQINYQSLMKQKKNSVLKRKSLLLKKLHTNVKRKKD